MGEYGLYMNIQEWHLISTWEIHFLEEMAFLLRLKEGEGPEVRVQSAEGGS